MRLTFELVSDSEEGDCEDVYVKRNATAHSIEDILEAFVSFLWNAGYNYVNDVKATTRGGSHFSGAGHNYDDESVDSDY